MTEHSKDAATLGTSGYERVDNDFYETPAWCTEALLDNIYFDPEDGVTGELACGKGAISRVLKGRGHKVISTDLIDRGYGIHGCDFLTMKELPHSQIKRIITNPPYGKLAEEFLVKALEFMMPIGGTVTMLLRNEYDCAKKRKYLFDSDSFFSHKLVMTTRPRWITGTKTSPRFNYAWYHFDTRKQPATITYV